MKTLNIKKSGRNSNLTEDYSDRMPCWYANFEFDGDRSQALWKVGVKGIDIDEYIFNISDAGDLDNEHLWNIASSAECAVQLIELFKQGQANLILKWVQSCQH